MTMNILKWFFGAILFVGLVACLPLKKDSGEPQEEPSSSSSEERKLSFSFVPAGEDPELPEVGLPAASEVFVRGNETEVKNAVTLPDSKTAQSKPLFLVWEARMAAKRVVDTRFVRRLFDLSNQTVGQLVNETVFFDSDHERFFVNLSRIFAGKEYELDPAQFQVFELGLTLEDGSRLTERVRVRLRPPVARILRENLLLGSAGEKSSAQDLVQALGTTGIGVARERWTNCSRSPVIVRVAVNADETRILGTTVVGVTRYKDKYFHGESLEPVISERWSSLASLVVSGLSVSGDPSRTVNFENGVGKLQLRPQEEVEVLWLAKRDLFGSRCSLPAPDVRSVSVCFTSTDPFSNSSSTLCGLLGNRSSPYFLSGFGVQAKIHAALQVDETGGGGRKSEEEGLSVVGERSVGDSGDRLPSFGCQGVF